MALLTGSSSPVQGLFARTAVRSFTDRRELLFAVKTFTTGDLEGGYDPFTNFAVFDLGADLLNNPAELMAEYVTFLKLGDGALGTLVSRGEVGISVNKKNGRIHIP